jgi:hypothetical protein
MRESAGHKVRLFEQVRSVPCPLLHEMLQAAGGFQGSPQDLLQLRARVHVYEQVGVRAAVRAGRLLALRHLYGVHRVVLLRQGLREYAVPALQLRVHEQLIHSLYIGCGYVMLYASSVIEYAMESMKYINGRQFRSKESGEPVGCPAALQPAPRTPRQPHEQQPAGQEQIAHAHFRSHASQPPAIPRV